MNISGIYRNEDMGDYADSLIAFWDGTSKGTSHMIKYARDKGLLVHIVKYKVKYMLKLHEGCYISNWEGDPGRTLDINSAKLYDSESEALDDALIQKNTHPLTELNYSVDYICVLDE